MNLTTTTTIKIHTHLKKKGRSSLIFFNFLFIFLSKFYYFLLSFIKTVTTLCFVNKKEKLYCFYGIFLFCFCRFLLVVLNVNRNTHLAIFEKIVWRNQAQIASVQYKRVYLLLQLRCNNSIHRSTTSKDTTFSRTFNSTAMGCQTLEPDYRATIFPIV